MVSHAPHLDRYQRRVGAFLLVSLSLIFLVVAGRLLYIQQGMAERLSAAADRQQRGLSPLPAQRGMILDARGRVVATSQWTPDVFIDPTRAEDMSALAGELGPRINLSAEEILNVVAARPNSRYVVLARQVDDVTAAAVRDMKHPAIGLTDHAARTYPLGGSMAAILGHVGRDGRGQEGIELQYDEHLCGRDGSRSLIRDARRKPLLPSDEPSTPAVDGGHVVLTLDAEIQRIAENALREARTHFEAESGVAIVMSPKTGDILAMASDESDDAPDGAKKRRLPTPRNRAITDPVEPGSAFKPVIICGALEGRHVSPTEMIDCHHGTYRFGSRTVTDTIPYGLMNLRDIMVRSSNIGMGKIATRMGNRVLYDTITGFGFGIPTGVGLPGEHGGQVHPLNKWTSYSTTSVCIGYELLVTPLQLASAFAAVLNDGVLLKPRVVRARLSMDGEVLDVFEGPDPLRRVTSTDVARYVAEDLLVAVVENGTARIAQTGPYKVLGKTGTAKLTHAGRRGYDHGEYQSTFVGAAPARDPALVALVMIRRPNPAIGYYGSKVAAPAVGDILTKSLAYLGVPADEEVMLAADRSHVVP